MYPEEESEMLKTERQELPKDIASQMKLWRNGFGGIPADYVSFHARIARAELQRLQKEYDLKVHGEPTLVRDGWMDGMKVLQAIVETPKGELLKLKYHDGNQGFMRKLTAGHGILTEADLTGKTSPRDFLSTVTF